MSQRTEQIEQVIAEGASHLLARATDSHSLITEILIPRIRASVGKYVLRDEPEAGLRAIRDFIDKLQADDLCLIVACEQGDQSAWSDLVARFSATVRSAARSTTPTRKARRISRSRSGQSCTVAGARRRHAGRKACVLFGSCSLAGWLRAVVAQLAVDQHRKQSRLVQTEEDADFDRIIQDGHEEHAWSGHGEAVNPEIQISRQLAGAEMQKALATSIKQLSAEDRLLVKLYYFDGLRLREAGAVLGVHEATASRRLTRVHSELRQQVERILVEQGWTKPETERAFSEVALHLEADIEPMLTTDGALLKKENEIAG